MKERLDNYLSLARQGSQQMVLWIVFIVYYKTIHSFCAVKRELEPSAGTQF
jgi:hypothetical protein